MSLRWKIAAMCMLVVFLPVYFLNRHAVAFFDRFTRTELERRMIDHAFLAGELYVAYLERAGEPAAPARFREQLERFGREVETRLRIVAPDGAVLFDSDPERGPDLAPGPPAGERPEIRLALGGRYGARSALTPGRRLMVYFAALPVRAGGEVVAAAYAARHTRPILRAIRELHADQLTATRLALAASAAFALLFAQTLTRRLRRLARRAREFASGDRRFDYRARGHDEIAELGRDVGRMAEEIEQKNTYNRDFLAATLHELKTPVTAIRGATEVLEAGAAEKPDRRAKFLGNIRFEADRLVRMVEQLAALTRLDAEEWRARKEEVDYTEALRGIVSRLEPSWPSPRARFALALPEAPLPARIVPARIEQVVANLLENAFRYTPPEGRVELRAEGRGDEVVTTVRDSGRGIAAADLPKVFDRFFTTEPKAQAREYGSGLGLSIARSIVEHHGGRMEAESAPGEGATFRFFLPRAGEPRG